MTQPFQPDLPPPDEGIPAADAGQGAPPPAQGFGVGGEEPDAPEQDASERNASEESTGDIGSAADTPFRTPDPTQIGPADDPAG